MTMRVQSMIDHLSVTYNQLVAQSHDIYNTIKTQSKSAENGVNPSLVSAVNRTAQMCGKTSDIIVENITTIGKQIDILKTSGIEQTTAEAAYKSALENASTALKNLNTLKQAFRNIGIRFSTIALLITAGIGLAKAGVKSFGGDRA